MSSSPTDQATAGTGGEIAPLAVTMPQMGVSVAEGTLVEWKKQVGDWVEADEVICAISTDKIDTDVEAPAAAADINRRLVEAGVAVHRLEPAHASLEQRFLEITTRLGEAA